MYSFYFKYQWHCLRLFKLAKNIFHACSQMQQPLHERPQRIPPRDLPAELRWGFPAPAPEPCGGETAPSVGGSWVLLPGAPTPGTLCSGHSGGGHAPAALGGVGHPRAFPLSWFFLKPLFCWNTSLNKVLQKRSNWLKRLILLSFDRQLGKRILDSNYSPQNCNRPMVFCSS